MFAHLFGGDGAIRFLNPYWLSLILLLPLAAFWLGRRGPVAAVQYSNVSIARAAARETQSRFGRWVWMFPFVAAALMAIGMARPQIGDHPSPINAEGIDIVLALDVSGSMQALDFKLNGEPTSRVDVVKSVVSSFIDHRPDDRIGVVAFAGAPYLVSPLTLDHSWLQSNLDRVRIGVVEDGTAIGSAIAAGVNRLRDTPAKSKVIVLLTDGMNNAGRISPLAAAEAAKALGVKVYTIAAGVRGEAPMPVKDEFGRTRLVMAKVDVDEETLQKISAETGGQSYRATDTDSLKEIYAEIDHLEKTPEKATGYANYKELFPWLVVPALLLLGVGTLLQQTRYRRLP